MSSIFSKIVSGQIPCHKIAETDEFLAFLDRTPLVEGHTLVIPKREEDYIFNLSDAELSGLMVFAKKVAAAVKAAIPCTRMGVSVIGLEVPHAHVHLVPIDSANDLNFTRVKMAATDEQLAAVAKKIKGFFRA